MMIWLTAAGVLIADQATKSAVLAALRPHESRMVIARLLYFTLVPNAHGAFGSFGSSGGLLAAAALATLAVVFRVARRRIARSTAARIGFGAVAGGTLSNVLDRVLHGSVVDFIDVRAWPVFNVADTCITLGLGILLVAGGARARA